jgi:uncharacterized membrane protein YhaH (DUF805 family)
MNLLLGFSGRIGRLNWWLGQLAIVGVLFVGAMLVYMSIGTAGFDQAHLSSSALVVIGATVLLATWINIATTVKRFHDRNKSGFWFLIVLIPYIGGLWQIVECGFMAGTPGTNNYGDSTGSSSFDDIEEEVRARYAEPVNRMATAVQSAPTAPRAAVQARRSVPTSGFGRRGSS